MKQKKYRTVQDEINEKPRKEYPDYILPTKEIVKIDNKPEWIAAITKLSKENAIKAIKGDNINIDAVAEQLVTNIWNAAYSKGLSDMDKMHALIDQK